jgi:xanthosine utilization system XapX-like protein
MLLLAVTLKLDPVRITASPSLALVGLNEVMTGTWAKLVKAQPTNITKRNKRLRLFWSSFIGILVCF